MLATRIEVHAGEIARYSKSCRHGCRCFASHCRVYRGRMDISIEWRIDELCDLAAGEHDYTKLKNVIGQLLECIDARQQQRDGARKISLPGGGQNENSR